MRPHRANLLNRTIAITCTLALSFALLALTSPPAANAVPTVKGEFEALITWIVDGDTIKFKRIDSKGKDICRLLHYNAPEMTGAERNEGSKAKAKLIGLLKGKRVMIWGVRRDRYRRLLCEVRLMDGTYINEIMRRFLKGYAKRDIYLWQEKNQPKREVD